MMIGVELFIVFGAIFLGARMGGIGIGYAGGLGVVALTLGLGMTPGSIPIDVYTYYYGRYFCNSCNASCWWTRLYG